ncbi:MAG: PP0621 family protein [Acidovorax sp.]|nr:PP0621 family protein [Acidovorax sp.]
MKYLVLLVVLVVAVGIWRSRRAPDASSDKSTSAPLALPQDMLACAHCGIHIPQAEALMLGNHAYCSAEHRRLGPA